MMIRYAATALLTLLTACEDKGETLEIASSDSSVIPTVSNLTEANHGPSSGGTRVAGSAALEKALTCWALTNRAYFMYQAVSGQAGNLPNPDPAVYRAWGNLAATTAHAAGMTLTAFTQRQQGAQQEATVYSVEVEAAHAQAVQACIDTAPPLGPDPELTWPDP